MNDSDANFNAGDRPTEPPALAVQPQLHYPLCVPCEKLFTNSVNLKGHLEKKHQESSKGAKERATKITEAARKIVSNEILHLREIYENAPFRPDGKTACGSLPALVGVEKVMAKKCCRCEYYIMNKRRMQQHIHREHNLGDQEADQLTDQTQQALFTVQTLQGGNQTTFFKVHDVNETIQITNFSFRGTGEKEQAETIPPNPMSISGSSHKYELDFFAGACEDREPQVYYQEQDNSEGTETYNDFIAATRVPDILRQEGIEVEEAARLTGQLKQETGPLAKELSRLSQLYLEKIASRASTAAPALLDTLFPRDDKSFEPVGKNTVRRYSQHLASFLVFAFHSDESKWMNGNVSALLECLRSMLSSPLDDDLKLDHIHKVMKETCLVRRSKSAGVQGLFVRLYFACTCVSVNKSRRGTTYRFVEASEVSHTLAAMQHFILGTALLELTEIGRTMNQSSENASCDGDESGTRIRREEDGVLLRVSRTENTALSFVRIILNICWGMLKRKTASFKLVQCKTHDYCAFIRGVELSLPFIGRCIRKWQKECHDIMTKELLCGGSYPPDLQDIMSHTQDNLQERSNGYSFLNHPSFSVISGRWQRWLLREIAENGVGAKKMFAEPVGSNNLWTEKQLSETVPLGGHRMYKIAIQRWLGACQRLQEILLLCLHLSSGSPARATEISTFRFQNSAYGPRNLYISQNELVTLCRYSKMRKQKGSDTHIVRVPDESTGYILKIYFLFFRRVESILVGRLHGEEKKRAHMHWVFVNRGERYSAQKIRTILWSGLAEQGKELGISDIRHFFTDMVRNVARFSVETTNELVEEFEDTGYAQAGHSTAISDRHYGRTDLDFFGLGKRSVEKSQMFCSEWHQCLFVWEDGRKAVRPRNSTGINGLREAGDRRQNSEEWEALSVALHDMKKEMRAFMKRTYDMCEKIENSDAGNMDHKKVRVLKTEKNKPSLRTPRARKREMDARLLLPRLRELLKKPNANFKSAIQADVSASVLEASEDIFVVMGTGSGKSMCILLPVFIEGGSYCSIVIIPLAALLVEWKKRCQSLGIMVASWHEREVNQAQIYVFAAEHIDTSEYRIFVRTLSSKGVLKRIVFDEAHGSITWDDFRPSMFKARFILGCSTKPVQRVLLSASVPPLERENLLTSYGMREAYLFTASTARNNLAFQVMDVGGSIAGDGSIALLKELSRSLRVEMQSLATLTGTSRIMIFVMRIKDTEVVRIEIERMVNEEQDGMLLVYHGKLPENKRLEVHNLWNLNNGKSTKVLICTSAIGAGIDSSNIMLVYHFGGCSSLVQYAQECGRAGRGNESAKCVLLWSEAFAKKQETIRARSVSTANLLWEKEYEERKYLWWDEVTKWVQDNSRCRRSALFQYLDGTDVPPCIYEECLPCDVCVEIRDGTNLLREGNNKDATIEFVTPVKKTAPKDHFDQTKNDLITCEEETRNFDGQSNVLVATKPGRTMVANHNEDRMTRKETLDFISSFETVCRRLDGLCIICAVLRREERIATDRDRCDPCSQDKSRCYKCLAKEHRFGDCHLPRFVQNHCNRCGLNKLDGKNAHQGTGFAKECPRPPLNNLFWLLWSKEETRQQMLTDLCTTSQGSILRDFVSSDGPYAKDTVEALLSWLHNKAGIPTHVRVLCWWGNNDNDR